MTDFDEGLQEWRYRTYQAGSSARSGEKKAPVDHRVCRF
jgi:hypothetical protein